jgi:hypothetical protein
MKYIPKGNPKHYHQIKNDRYNLSINRPIFDRDIQVASDNAKQHYKQAGFLINKKERSSLDKSIAHEKQVDNQFNKSGMAFKITDQYYPNSVYPNKKQGLVKRIIKKVRRK